MRPTGTAKRERLVRVSGGLLGVLVFLAACRSPAAAPPAGAAGMSQAARLPEPGVYVLQRARGLALPADLEPPGFDPRRRGYFERILAGRLYVTPEGGYQTIICADLVDSAGRVPNPMDRGEGWGRRYWASGGRVYFSNIIVDGPVDSIAVRVRGDSVEFVDNVFVRDRTSVAPRYPLTDYVCPTARASFAKGTRPSPRGVIH